MSVISEQVSSSDQRSPADDPLIQRIDALPANAGLWRFIVLLSLGGFFELYDLFQTGYISRGLVAEGIFFDGPQGLFGIADQAAFACATFIGLFLGASLLSPAADRFGRRLTFMFALSWYGIFSLLMAGQSSAEGVIICRFLVSIGLGVELVTIDTYLSEWVPCHLRNRAFAWAFFIQFLSVPCVALMSWWLVPHTFWGITGWRWVVIVGAVCSLVIWAVRRKLPESARWLASRGRYREAGEVLETMERRCGIHSPQPLAATTWRPALTPRAGFRAIWSVQYRSRTLMLMTMNFFQAIGFFGFGNWLPTLLAGQGASFTHSLQYAFLITLAYPLGCLVCSRFADRLENKWQIVASSLMTVIFGTLFALSHMPWLMVFCGFAITWSNAWLTISYHAYQAEIFPTAIRARAVGFCYSFSRLSTALTSLMIGLILNQTGSSGVIMFIVFSMLIVMLSVGVFGPRTRGRSLEQI